MKMLHITALGDILYSSVKHLDRRETQMIIKTDIYLSEFDAWSGARDTLDRIINEGKCDELESMLEDMYPEGMTDTELNDLLWFDWEEVFEWLDIEDEDDEDDEEDEDEE